MSSTPPTASKGERALAGLLGAGVLLAMLPLSVLALFVGWWALAVPDAYTADTDQPDSWAEAILHFSGGVTAALLAGFGWVVVVAALRHAGGERGMSTVEVVAFPAALAAIYWVVGGWALVLNRDDARLAPSCDAFRLDREVFRSQIPEDEWARQALGLERCDTLDGATTAQVRDALGKPTHRRRDGSRWSYRGTELRVHFEGGRVTSMRYMPYEPDSYD